ncbi:MAG: PorV/PorQ family protein [Melioribacteraceae bacterium]|nr:PorV/PorQ family protein [Melioribacteraceae bacterium]
MKKILIIQILLLLIMSNITEAQLTANLGGQRAGISTAQFLKIGVGGRATAMGDAFIAVADDASALYWNPAGLVQGKTNENQVIFSHNEWVIDIKHEFAGVVYHFSDNDAIGVSFTSLHMEDMPVTTEFNPFGTGEYFSVGDLAFGLSYSKKLTSQFSFGATFKYMESTLDRLKMRGVMVDLGTYYWTGLGTSRFAVTVTNFGNQLAPDGEVVLWGNRKKSDWQEFSPPTMFRIGFALEPYMTDEHRVTTSIQLNHPNDNSENVSLGAEYSWKEIFYLRSGYRFNADSKDYTFGAGLKVPAGIANVTVDYSYSNLMDLGSAHRFSILLGLY